VLEPIAVELVPLPLVAPELHRQARAFFRLLVSLRLAWMTHEDALLMQKASRASRVHANMCS
jgi:hypothetical protein